RRVHEDDLGILERLDLQHRLVRNRGAVARVDMHAVHVETADGRHEIGVAVGRKPILGAVASLPRGAEHPRLGADGKRILVARKAAGERHEAAGPIGLAKCLAPHDGSPPSFSGSIQIWKMRVGMGSRLYSAWRMPEPALVTCTSRASVRPLWPRLSSCVIAPWRT